MSQNQLNRVMPIRIADAKLKIRHVFIRDYLTTCLIGIYTHEKANKQRVRINIDLAASETDHPINDKIVNVVCYEKLVNGIDEIIERGHVNLVETLAERIIDMCLNQENVISARVRIEKLDVLENAESVGVEVERCNT